MADESQLVIITETAVALAGFAGVVASFQFSGNSHISRGNILGLSMMILMSLNVALFSLIPIMISNFGASDAMVWGLSSFAFGLTWPIGIPLILKHYRKLTIRRASTSLTFLGVNIMSTVITVALFLNAFDLVIERGPGVYFASLVFPLALSGYMFVRLVVRPLWREVRIREAAEAIVET